MDDRTMADNLDQYLDALAMGGEQRESTIDPALTRLARRYRALGESPAPDGACDRVQRRIEQNLARPRQNGGSPASQDREVRLAVRGEYPVQDHNPSPLHIWIPPAPERQGRGRPHYAVVTLIILVLLGVGAMTYVYALRRPEPLTFIPAAVVPTELPVPTLISSLPAITDQALLVIDLPAGSLPEAFGATFDQRTMPPHSQATDLEAGALLLRYVVSGQVNVRSAGPMWLLHTDGESTREEIPAGEDRDLGPGDAIFLDDAASVTLVNNGDAPVSFIAWTMTADGAGNSEVPEGWSLHHNAAVHMARLEQADRPTQLRLRRIELAPGADLAPSPDALVDQMVYLDVNAAGERVAPMLGKLANGGRRNAGRQALTMYHVSVDQPGGDGDAPPADRPSS